MGDGSWMTYGQLAEARQIGRRAAVRLAQRHHLRRQPTVRVWVPADMAASSPFRSYPPATPDDVDADDTPVADATPFHAQALAALEDAFAKRPGRRPRAWDRCGAFGAGDDRQRSPRPTIIAGGSGGS